MPIEFRCYRCQRLLRTADDSGGKQTRCPECGTILDIPVATQAASSGATASTPFAAATGPAPASSAGNPYASSQTRPVGAQVVETARGFKPTIIDLGDVINRTWAIYSKNLADMIVAGLIMIGVSIALIVPFVILLVIGVVIGGTLIDKGREPIGILIIVVSGLTSVLAMLAVSLWLYAGMAIWLLKAARGEPRTYGDIFQGGRYMTRLTGAGIIVGLAVLLGHLLCIIPGIIVGLVFSQFLWVIVDRNVQTMESLSLSNQLTTGNKLTLFLLSLLVLVINGLGQVVPFAFVFTVPFIWLMFAVTYLRISGQSTADMPTQTRN